MVTLTTLEFVPLVVAASGFAVSLAYIVYAKVGGEKAAEEFVGTQRNIVDHIDSAATLVTALGSHAADKAVDANVYEQAAKAASEAMSAAQKESAVSSTLAGAVVAAIQTAKESLPASPKQS